MSSFHELIRKYNTPVPRYTSYPTVPCWDNQLTAAQWENELRNGFVNHAGKGVSLYVHLPYCESLCTYCGCNTRITVNHAVEKPYIDALLREWKKIASLSAEKIIISELHFGGGTPTFFAPAELKRFTEGLLEFAEFGKDAVLGFEAHPGKTSYAHLETLAALGFRRLSLGIQDFDPKVQDIVNRHQTFEVVEEVTKQARALGYDSINYDLIYGLPLQTKASVIDTIEKTIRLRPDRIAFYSYAHVPWIKPGQRKFTEADLPSDEIKRDLYETGRELLCAAGYNDIGMDHFALPQDELSVAADNRSLHRNFMGYTPRRTPMLLALGVSSIADTGTAFGQNIKTVEEYLAAVNRDEWPLWRGHLLTEEDRILRDHVLDIMCRYETSWADSERWCDDLNQLPERLKPLLDDQLIEVNDKHLVVTETGKAFLRNICSAFDARLYRMQQEKPVFSKAV